MRKIKNEPASLGVSKIHGTSPEVQYNVKVYDYGTEQQIRVFRNKITKGGKKRIISKAHKTDSEILKSISSSDYGTMEHFENQLKDMEQRAEKSLKSSANRAKNTVYEYARANEWEYFFTMTFDPKKIDSTDYDVVVEKLGNWLQNIKKRYAKNMKYVMVPELHSDGKKYHFHGLVSDIGDIKLVDSGKKDKFKRVIYNVGNYKMGWTTVTKIHDTKKASNYISKYITKTLCETTKGKKRYWVSRNVKKPNVSELNMPNEDIKKLLESVRDQVAHKTSVEVPETTQHIDYYEIRISDE